MNFLKGTGLFPSGITLIVLIAILLLALGLRVNATLINPFPASEYKPGSDKYAYRSIAYNLRTKGEFRIREGGVETRKQATDYSPGLPFFLAGIYLITGTHLKLGLLAIGLLGVLMVLFTYFIAYRLANARAGLVAAFVAAIYPAFLWYTRRPSTEPLGGFLFVATVLALLWAATRKQSWAWLVPGTLLGLTAFVRPEFLVVMPLLAALILFKIKQQETLRIALRGTALFVLSFALILTPWTVRNYQLFDRYVPTSTGGGKALFIGTNLPAGGTHDGTKKQLAKRYLSPCKEAKPNAQHCYDPNDPETISPAPLLNRVAKKYPQLSRDNALGRIGKEHFRKYAFSQPFAYTKMVVRKAATMWRTGASQGMKYSLGWRIMQWLLLALGAFGVVALWQRQKRWEVLILLAAPVMITAAGAMLLAVPRRVLPLQPIIFVLASVGLFYLIDSVRRLINQRESRTLALKS